MMPGQEEAIARGLDAAHRHAAITERAASAMVPRLVTAPHVENLWRCGWDAEGEILTSAEWLGRGTRDRVTVVRGWLEVGDVVVHNHGMVGIGSSLQPSEADLDTAAKLAAEGIGTGIVSPDLAHFLLLYPPRHPTRLKTFTMHRLFSGSGWGLAFTRSTTTTRTL
jgi:hypothetical protein